MMNRPQPGPDIELENQVNSWLRETNLEPDEAERGLDRLMETFPATPQTRRRILGRWLDRGDEARRGTDVHDLQPDTRRRNRIMFTATAMAAGLALVAVSAAVVTFDDTTTRIVAADGTGDFDSISAAVEAAEPGDIIVVRAGRYNESVVIDKDLTIMGDRDGGETIVRIPDKPGPRRWEDNPFAFKVQDADADIGHFTFEGSSKVTSIFVHGGHVSIHDIIDDVDHQEEVNALSFFGWIDGDSTGTISDVVTPSSLRIMGDASPDILGNTIGGVLVMRDRSAPRVVGNQLSSITVDHQAAPIIEHNRVDVALNTNFQPSECRLAVGAKEPGPMVVGNEFRSGDVGICARNGSSGTFIGNEVVDTYTGLLISRSDATFVDNDIRGGQNGVAISDGSPTLEGNEVRGAQVGLVMTMMATPTLVDNTFCGNVTDFLPVAGAQPLDLSRNTVCNGTPVTDGVASEAAVVGPGSVLCLNTNGVRPANGEVPDLTANRDCGGPSAP